jgi:hypothetical protein
LRYQRSLGFSLGLYCTHNKSESKVGSLDFSVFCVYAANMKTTTTKRRGRPPKGSQKVKGLRLDMRVDAAEKEAFRAAAELCGLDLSAWIRERLRRASRNELQAAGQPVPFLARRGES